MWDPEPLPCCIPPWEGTRCPRCPGLLVVPSDLPRSTGRNTSCRGTQPHAECAQTRSSAASGLTEGFVLAGEFSHKLQRLSSNGTMSSSEELEEKDENAASFEQSR